MDGSLTTYFRKRTSATPSAPIKPSKLARPTERAISPVVETLKAHRALLLEPKQRQRQTHRQSSPQSTPNTNQSNNESPSTTQEITNERIAKISLHSPAPTASETKYDSKLELPDHYKLLAEIFRSADICVAYMHNRRELCTFNKLRKPVERMTKKAFNMQRLAQIMTVLPKAYQLRYDYSLPDSSSFRDFTQSPNRYTERLIIELKVDDNQIRPRHLDERRLQFGRNLLSMVALQYEKFLADSKIPPSGGPVRMWHPFFRLDNVKPIESKSLDIEPDKGIYSPSKKKKSVEVVLAKAKRRLVWDEIPGCSAPKTPAKPEPPAVIDVLDANNNTPVKAFPRVADSPIKTPNKSLFESPVKWTPTKPSAPVTDKIASGPLKGVSLSLLEKIKVRELESSKTSPESERRADLISRLPEIARTIQTYFTSESKECMPHDKVINRIATSATLPATASTINECIDILLEIAPEWISTIKITRGRYMRINKAVSLQTVIKQIEDHK